MAEASATEIINKAADILWQDISTFDATMFGLDCTVEGQGVGATRTLLLPNGGGQVVERLEDLDDAAKQLRYVMVKGSMPVQHYTGLMQVRDLGSNQAEVTWSATFETPGLPEIIVKTMVANAFAGGLATMKQFYEE